MPRSSRRWPDAPSLHMTGVSGRGFCGTVAGCAGGPMFRAVRTQQQPGFHEPHQSSRPALRRRPRRPRRRSAPLPEWNLADLYPAMDAPEVKRDLDRGETECVEFEKAYKGTARRHRGRPRRRTHARRGGAALRGDRGPARPADLLCGAALCRQHHRSRASPSSTATCRSASPRPRCICCSSRSSSTASTTPCSTSAMADPALGHYRPWIEDIRKDKPYQLEDRIEQLFHEKSVTGYSRLEPAVRRDHGGAALQGRRQDAAARADAQPACRTPTPKKRKAAAEALAKTFKENLRLFTLITNTLAKDKEISDRWRGFERRRATRATSPTASSPRWSTRWSRRCATPIRGCRTAITR